MREAGGLAAGEGAREGDLSVNSAVQSACLPGMLWSTAHQFVSSAPAGGQQCRRAVSPPPLPPRLRRRGGARLSHSHDRQYAYVLQSLTLWREISHEVGPWAALCRGKGGWHCRTLPQDSWSPLPS